MAQIDALRSHIAGMMGKGMKSSPSMKAKVKTKGKSKMMMKKSKANC